MRIKLIMILLLLVISLNYVFGAAPVVGPVSASTPINLNAGSTKDVSCNATITDLDGFQNITIANATLFDSTNANPGSPDDNNNHYTNASCTLSGGSGNTTNAVCGFSLQYYANPGTSWECNMTAYDDVNTGSNTTGQTITVEELKALIVTSLSFDNGTGSSIDLGNTSGEETLNITNTGNINITVQVSGDSNAMSCSIGTIPLSNERYNITSGFSFAGGIQLTSTATNVSGFIVPQRTNDASPSINFIYWLLRMPTTGVGGSCSGNITVSAN